MTLVGLILLIHRRLAEPRIRLNSRPMDIAVLLLFLAQLLLGLVSIGASAQHRDGEEMIKLMLWAQHIVTFRGDAAGFVADVAPVFKLHLVLGMAIFVIFPFTRLVHVWSGFAAVAYLVRAYQVVRFALGDRFRPRHTTKRNTAMRITVNDTIIPAAAIAVEAVLHAGAPDPDAAARRTLAIRELLLQRAGELGLMPRDVACADAPSPDREAEERIIEQVLATDVRTPAPTREECLRYYETHPEQFTAGELVEARHILFAIMPGTPVMALRDHAERTLAELKNEPERFAERAGRNVQLPLGPAWRQSRPVRAGRDGAGIRQGRIRLLRRRRVAHPRRHPLRLSRHRDRAADRRPAGSVRRGRSESRQLSLRGRVEERALKQYIEVLAGRAFVDGADLAAAASPLVQ